MKITEIGISSGERFSFFQLVRQKDLCIEIPIIQRDYAQGRKTTREVRVKFLNALYTYLVENKPYRDLDFVYGSISKREDDSLVFIPLDGQQRLTTLFLLHWYLALISDRATDLQRYLVSGNKSKFTYETRSSAREFCDALMVNSHTVSKYSGKCISAVIQNSSWYFLSWKDDPTVQSMLTMLDAIEEQFKDCSEFFGRLVDMENPIITFQFLDLREFQLTDDLYIKMNSRGKPLTPFENFKAKLAQRIEELFKDDGQQSRLKRESGESLMDTHDYFSWKIDIDWADFFWKHRDTETSLYDTRIMNFIRVVLANSLSVNSDPLSKVVSNLLGTQGAQKSDTYSDDLSFFDYVESGALTKNAINALIKSFDALLKSEKKSDNDAPDQFNYDAGQILQAVLQHRLTNQNRIKFHAFLGYLINYDDTAGLRDWMRVVHNLTVNTAIDHTDELVRCLMEINKLLPNANQILNFLSLRQSSIGAFYQRQVQEEEVKALLILKDDRWSDLIRQTDRNWFFNGQIAFLLEFSGILEYVEKTGDCNWNDDDNDTFRRKFENYRYKADASFAYARDFNDEFLWERAILTKGDYLMTASYWRKNFLSSKDNTRDYSWKRLLRLSGATDHDRQQLTQRRLFIKEVLDDDRFNPLDVGLSCSLIIQDIPQDWRAYFIRNYKLIEACGQGFIRFESDTKIRLLTKSKLTYHYELRSYNLYLQKIQDRRFLPFVSARYDTAYGESGVCAIVFGHWLYEGPEYFLRIFFIDHFTAEFYEKTNSQIGTVEEPVMTILTESGFILASPGEKVYTWTGENDDLLMEMVEKLCHRLNTLYS